MRVPPPSDAVPRAAALAEAGRVSDGYRLLQRALLQGDAAAAFELAEWRLSGHFVRRDLDMARELFGRAAALGRADAAPIHIAMLANGAGGALRRWSDALARLRAASRRDHWAARQVKLIEAMPLRDDGEPSTTLAGQELRSSPRVARFPGFLTPAECAYLIDRAGPLLQPAVIVDPVTGALLPNRIRTSKAAAFPFIQEDPAIHAINRRIAAATGTTYEQGEPLQVLSYAPGQEYKLHSDALPPGSNQRILTFLVYLNDNYAGGETEFPDLGVSHRGGTGDGLLFVNVDGEGRLEPRARHAGLPIRSGCKWLLSKWIREHPLDLSGPPGRPF
jgi:prolyl 4-hydroxylase